MKPFSGIAFSAFISLAAATGLACLGPALTSLEAPKTRDVLQGKWEPLFEKSFGKALPVTALSRDGWGRAEYVAFGQGRKEVVTGLDGWLFTAEEFSCPPKSSRNMLENLVYIDHVQQEMAAKNVQLAIVLVPAKARVLPERLGMNRLPACRTYIYENIQRFMAAKNIPVTDLLPAMLASPRRESLYLKTDTHWSPRGARLAAAAVARLAKGSAFPVSTFSSRPAGIKGHEGDLVRYLPGVPFQPEYFDTFITGQAVASRDASTALFSDDAPPVTLVGTSYSAESAWNFEGFLKEALKTDILNAANEGLGPFVVMDKYLADDTWKNTPPRMVVWEMPERYFLMPHGAPAN